MSEPKYHHYVSNFYLKKFAVEASQKFKLNVFDKFTGEIQSKKRTDKIGGCNHFNRSFSETDPNDVEKFYAREIETQAGAALKRILNAGDITSNKDLSDVLLFFAMTTARNPSSRSRIEDPMRKLDELVIRDALGDEGADVLEKRLHRDLLPQEHVEMELPRINPIFESLVSKSWEILETTAETGEFITCDDPLQIVHADEAGPCWGFRSNGAIVYAPLCPNLAILGSDRKRSSSKASLDKEHVAALNFGTIISAYQHVYYKSDNFYVLQSKEHKAVKWSAELARAIQHGKNIRKQTQH